METQEFTAVYFDNSFDELQENHSFQELQQFLLNIPEIITIWYANALKVQYPAQLAEIINNKKIYRIILVGHGTGFIKSFFDEAMQQAGRDKTEVKLVQFTLQNYLNTGNNKCMKELILAALYNIPEADIICAHTSEVVHDDTLVIGAGIAGIQAALEIANSGQKVHLVETEGTIGGHMAMFDKTFPTLDCAACILTPKMVEVGQNEKIELHTKSTVIGISGSGGNYRVRLLKKARRVSLEKCIACGTCSEKCPVKVPSEFDAGTGLRKAIYIPFPQAVPNKYLVDPENCIYVQKGKCGVCVKVCPVDDCINLDEKDETVDINVGNIIVATGFKTFDPSVMKQYGYGAYLNVITSIELERLVNAAGPTGGNITLPVTDKKGHRVFNENGKIPKSFALIHCIGSRDLNHHPYCSRVCCMYSLKLAHLIKEKIPDAEVFEYYIDIRAFGKGYEEFYRRIENEGIHLIRGKAAKVTKVGDQLIVRGEDVENDKLIEQQADMVVLAVGLEPSEGQKELADILAINTDHHGWLNELNNLTDSVNSSSGGIYIAGTCQGPKDIPDTVAQASFAAARVLKNISMHQLITSYGINGAGHTQDAFNSEKREDKSWH